jgi:hypothetical protein
MSHTSRRKLQLVFGAAVFASLGFGVTQVAAEARAAEESRSICAPPRPYECVCNGVVTCQSFLPCRLCT